MMTHKEFYTAFAEENRLPRTQARMICEAVFYFLKKTILKVDDVRIRGFGTFRKRKHGPTKYMNVHKGRVEISGDRWKIQFLPSENLALDHDGNPIRDPEAVEEVEEENESE